VTVRFPDGRTETGNVAGVDVDADLAVIEVDTAGAPTLDWGEGDVAAGTLVIAVTPTSNGGPRLTWGPVSATGQAFRGPRGRRIADALEHAVPLPRGSSGGPLVDTDGKLIGINTHRRGDGFYLALPVNAELRSRLDALGRGETPRRVTLGISVAPAHVARRLRSSVGLEPQDGLLVRGVDSEGPAGRAGVRSGDLIVEAAGQPVASSDDLFRILDQTDAGATLNLRVVRGVERVEIAVRFTAPGEEGSA
jgi:serine protease Do